MSILFKGNLEEGNYTLIKSTDGWVLKGETSYAGFNFADRPQGEWIIRTDNDPICRPWYNTCKCSKCGQYGTKVWNYCPWCGADMRGEEE